MRKNKKFIDPRYFMNEKTEETDKVTGPSRGISNIHSTLIAFFGAKGKLAVKKKDWTDAKKASKSAQDKSAAQAAQKLVGVTYGRYIREVRYVIKNAKDLIKEINKPMNKKYAGSAEGSGRLSFAGVTIKKYKELLQELEN